MGSDGAAGSCTMRVCGLLLTCAACRVACCCLCRLCWLLCRCACGVWPFLPVMQGPHIAGHPSWNCRAKTPRCAQTQQHVGWSVAAHMHTWHLPLVHFACWPVHTETQIGSHTLSPPCSRPPANAAWRLAWSPSTRTLRESPVCMQICAARMHSPLSHSLHLSMLLNTGRACCVLHPPSTPACLSRAPCVVPAGTTPPTAARPCSSPPGSPCWT